VSAKFDRRAKALQDASKPLEALLGILSSLVSPPILYDFIDGHRGYRYEDPGLIHFCLLKGAKAVSAYNASVVLLRSGYTQEIAVLIRTLIECTRHIDFALGGMLTNQKQDEKPQKFVESYFEDENRGFGELKKKPHERQENIHKGIAAEARKVATSLGQNADDFDMIGAMRRTYEANSNYVHARYPELMDMYGGTPGRFHLRGMRDTPKDLENLEVLECYLASLENCFALMVHSLALKPAVATNKTTAVWFEERRRLAALA